MEDYYTYYVMLLEMSEDLFWHADIAFVQSVAENKAAFDGWHSYVVEREREKQRRRMKHKRG